MSIYAIGDVQGCFHELENLLAEISFDPKKDSLWFTGDLVNRGLKSLEVIRYIKNLGERHQVVLGNHDLHLLAIAYGVKQASSSDTLDAILAAPDKIDLVEWLRFRPLIHYNKEVNYVLVHAGLAPPWSLGEAISLAHEAEEVLRGDSPATFLRDMYGNHPDHWEDSLTGMDRLRCIINYLTRMRFCYTDGRMELSYKGDIQHRPASLIPWFDVPYRTNVDVNIIFGHWAALNGETTVPHIFPLDTGCVWGNCLTAMRLEDQKRFRVKCKKV